MILPAVNVGIQLRANADIVQVINLALVQNGDRTGFRLIHYILCKEIVCRLQLCAVLRRRTPRVICLGKILSERCQRSRGVRTMVRPDFCSLVSVMDLYSGFKYMVPCHDPGGQSVVFICQPLSNL